MKFLLLVAAVVAGAQAFTTDHMNSGSVQLNDRTNTVGFSHVGCFRDNPVARDLPVPMPASQTMTPRKCNDLCSGYDYFGVQIHQCFCGNSYGSVKAQEAASSGSGITQLERGEAQVAYETATEMLAQSNTVQGLAQDTGANNKKYVQEVSLPCVLPTCPPNPIHHNQLARKPF